jgi:hypothetical protein
MSQFPNLTGWVRNDEAIDAFCQTLSARSPNGQVAFGAAKSEFKGTWKRLAERGSSGVFLQDAEMILFGRYLPADSQARGTCVSRGTFRACQDSYFHSLTIAAQIGTPAMLCFEPIYGGARVNIGRGNLGYSDGAYGAYAAQWVHDYGLLPRGKYGQWDLSKAREDLAVDWGNPGRGVPRELIEQSKGHLVASCFQCQTLDDVADAIACGYGVAFCCNSLWQIPDGQSTRRDADGMCRPVTGGAHCEEVRGIFIDHKGRLCFLRQNSWGDYPRGGRLRLKDGRELELPPGSYGAFADDMQRAMASSGGDVWAFGGIQGWRPESTAEALK